MTAGVTPDIIQLLAFALDQGASDVHITTGEPPVVRVHGDLRRVDMPPLDENAVHALVYSVMNDLQRLQFEKHLELDMSFELGRLGRFRINVFADRCGLAVAMRVVPSAIPSLALLGLPQVVRRLCDGDAGLVLVTGPTGCGKSTTLAAMIDVINSTSAGRIITVEDPIEFVHRSKQGLVSQREIGMHTRSFADALRGALREDPDVILVGEMRDLETMKLAITAAETGHLVLSTLHAKSASQSVDRIIDVYPPGQQDQVRGQLADCLLAVVTQTLLPRRGGGRVCAAEVLVAVPAARALIRDSKTHQLPTVMQMGQKDGMQTMESAIADLVEEGLVAPDDAAAPLKRGALFRQESTE